MAQKLAVIGCGNMGQAIVRGLLESGWKATDIVATHPDEGRAAALARDMGVQVSTDNVAAAKDADIVLLGVKPQIIQVALKQLHGHVRPEQLVISIAAGISTGFIESHTGDAPVVRCMPNLAVNVRMGATAMCAGGNATATHMETARAIFESVGTVESVDESLMDAVTGLSGTGPMYVFHLVEAMADAGVKVGLPRDVAQRLSEQTVRGSARLAQLSDQHPAALKDQVTSPGGTAIAALHVLRKQAFAAVVMDAVEAATMRSTELGA